MCSVIIFDILGAYCGMHYYDMAFAEILREHKCKTIICSNFTENKSKPYLKHFFSCGKIKGFLRIFLSYWTFLFLVIRNRKSKIVYLTYGELYEIPYLLISSLSNKVYIDVHEIHALKYKDKSIISKFFEWIYKHGIHNVIYHSDRTGDILRHDKLNMIYAPHFKYIFQKKFDEDKLSNEIKKCFNSNKIKFLFFGNLSRVKGIDIVLTTFDKLRNESVDFELVIAGKNVDNIDFAELNCDNIKIIDRHINDDELVYLYSSTDYVLLPYKKSSQSGIFAMAAYFHKPMILTDIPYFKKMIEEYPSFGICVNESLFKEVIISQIREYPSKTYYKKEDCERFEMKKEMDEFVKSFIGYNKNSHM